MSKKIKDILFYCVAAVLAIGAFIGAIIDANNREGNLTISIIIAVAAIELLVLSGIEIYDTASSKDIVDESKSTVNEAKDVPDIATSKKASIKKSSTKKSSK